MTRARYWKFDFGRRKVRTESFTKRKVAFPKVCPIFKYENFWTINHLIDDGVKPNWGTQFSSLDATPFSTQSWSPWHRPASCDFNFDWLVRFKILPYFLLQRTLLWDWTFWPLEALSLGTHIISWLFVNFHGSYLILHAYSIMNSSERILARS